MSLLQALFRGGWLRHVDIALARSMLRARAETPDLVLCAAALTSRAVANGHSQLPLSQVDELLLEISSEREAPTLPPLDEWLSCLRASPWLEPALGEAILVLEDDALSLRRYWRYEQRLAAALATRLKEPVPASDPFDAAARVAQLFPARVSVDDDAQAAAARAALSTRLLLLTGGPGTGKTTTVARTMVLFAERFLTDAGGGSPRILLSAPTGKAAARLAESVRENLDRLLAEGLISAALAESLPSEAMTVHRLLGWQRNTIAFRHGTDHPLSADLVIVDEASMIDLPLMCKLLEAVPASATLILIGDRDQLPSVETGDVLAALCDARSINATRVDADSNTAIGTTADLFQPSRTAHRVHLSHSHRQADDVDVLVLANLVRNGNVERALAGLAGQEFRGVAWQQGGDRALADAVLAQALPAYRALQAAPNVQAALSAAKQFRVLTAVREGGAGSQTLNALIASALDPARRGDGFFPGRLVLINENSYRHRLFNGDIGIVWADEFGEPRVWFDADGGPRAWLPAALPAHESAFALTVHKSQGSEFEHVFFALPEHGARVISRELLYTGLTRCRRDVTLWAAETVLRDGIERKAQRWSGLARRLL